MNTFSYWPGKLSLSAMTSRDIVPLDASQALGFLKATATTEDSTVAYRVSAIHPDGSIQTRAARRDDIESLRPLIEENIGTHNLYYSPNPTNAVVHKKASKRDVAEVTYLQVDIDPRDGHDRVAERKRILADLEAFTPHPSVIIDSGNGYQALWRLREPIGAPNEDIHVPEIINKRIADSLGGDHCHNIDHLLRVPGTNNFPNKTKRQKGRKQVPAKLVYMDNTAYDLSDFDKVLPSELREAMRKNQKLWNRWRGDTNGLKDTSRSGMDMSVASLLVSEGCSDEQILEALFLFEYGKAQEAGDPYIKLTIAKVRAQNVPDGSQVILPSDHFSFTDAAKEIFPRLAKTGRYYTRGGHVFELRYGPTGIELIKVTPETFRSIVEKLGPTYAHYSYGKGEVVLKQRRCSNEAAKALINTSEARDLLPRIRNIVNAPLLAVVEDKAKVLKPGYNAECGGVFVINGDPPPDVLLTEAVDSLKNLLRDNQYVTPGDQARALAALISPALHMGNMIDGPFPIQIAEADASQTGKTLFLRAVATVYGEKAYPIARKDGGVGSLDESLSAGLMSARTFILFDNMRGKVDSQFLEMVITSDGHVFARIPHYGEVQVDVSGTNFQMTSNGAETTRDLANRASIIRMLKHPQGHVWHHWAEGGLLQHIVANQPFYLGCVFAVVRHWIEAGRPCNKGLDHDMWQWAGALDWIVREVFGCASLIEGHGSAQDRVSNPDMVWLRAVALAVVDDQRDREELSATALVDLSESAAIDLPRTRGKYMDESQAARHIGKLLARLFKHADSNVITVDHMTVERIEKEKYDDSQFHYRKVKRYIVRTDRIGHITSTENQISYGGKGSYAVCAEASSCGDRADNQPAEF